MHDHLTGTLTPFGGHALTHVWRFHGGWLLVGLVLLVGYALAVHQARRSGSAPHPARIGCFVGGVLVLEVTLASAIDTYAMSLFWVHMVEHLILIMVVPALLVLGCPLRIVRDGLTEPTRGRFEAVLRSPEVSLFTHPLFGVAFYAAVIVGTHLTNFMDQMAMHSWLMTGEQALYVVAGYSLLLPLIGQEPIRWQLPYLLRIVVLVLAMIPDTVVGIVLMQTNHDPFPVMMGMHPSWAPAPIDDLHTGGGLMWAAGDGLMMCVAVGVVIALISSTGRRDQMLGPWLENVRRQAMVDNVAHSGAEPAAEHEGRVDEDEDMLAAYNRMLTRLNEPPGR